MAEAAQRVGQFGVGGDERTGRGAGQRRLARAEAIEGFEQHRGRGGDAGHAGHRRAIRTADPDADHRSAVEADGPGIAIAIGGAGLVGDAAGRAVERRRHVGEDIGHIPGGDRIEHGGGLTHRRLAGTAAVDEVDRHAAAGEGSIGGDEVAQRHADAAEADGEARSGVGRQRHGGIGAAQAGDEAGGTDGIEHDDSGDVERFRQGRTDADGAAGEAIEIDGNIGAEGGGAVLDQRFRVG